MAKPPPPRRPGDPNPKPATTELDQFMNVQLYGSSPAGNSNGQEVQLMGQAFGLWGRWKTARAKKRAMARVDAERAAARGEASDG